MLWYLRARYYDPATGRFTRMDTWPGEDEYPVTLNKYLYANADPVGFLDPTGMMSIASISAGARVNGSVRGTVLNAGERQAKWLLEELKSLLTDEAQGLLWDIVIQHAAGSLAHVLDAAEAAGTDPSKQAIGSSSHAEFKRRMDDDMEKVDRILGKFDMSMRAEFFMVDGEAVNTPNKRPKGSTGIDIAIFKPAHPQNNPVFLIDLKTGRPWSKSERNRIVQGLGGKGLPIEIMVNFRK